MYLMLRVYWVKKTNTHLALFVPLGIGGPVHLCRFFVFIRKRANSAIRELPSSLTVLDRQSLDN